MPWCVLIIKEYDWMNLSQLPLGLGRIEGATHPPVSPPQVSAPSCTGLTLALLLCANSTVFLPGILAASAVDSNSAKS